MLSDLLVFPIIIIGSIGLKALLLSVGITNTVIFLSCLFLILHLSFTSLMYLQVYNLQDDYISKIEISVFAAVIISIVAICAYCVIGLIPILKTPFFFLKYLPYSANWSDLFIVAIPTYITHVLSRKLAHSILS